MSTKKVQFPKIALDGIVSRRDIDVLQKNITAIVAAKNTLLKLAPSLSYAISQVESLTSDADDEWLEMVMQTCDACGHRRYPPKDSPFAACNEAAEEAGYAEFLDIDDRGFNDFVSSLDDVIDEGLRLVRLYEKETSAAKKSASKKSSAKKGAK